MVNDVAENRLNRMDQIVERDGAEHHLTIDGDQRVAFFRRQHGGQHRRDVLAQHFEKVTILFGERVRPFHCDCHDDRQVLAARRLGARQVS